MVWDSCNLHLTDIYVALSMGLLSCAMLLEGMVLGKNEWMNEDREHPMV